MPRINWASQIQSCINTTTHTKKGQFNLNYPLIDLASKMPLLISLPEKCTNILEDTDYGNAMFQKFKGVVQFFTDEIKRAAHWNCPPLSWLRDRWPKRSALMGERR
jgi:hypothetical protein